MRIDISELLSKRNFSKDFSFQYDNSQIRIASVDYPIRKKKPFEFHLANEENRRLYIHGNGELQVAISCDRCLKETEVTLPLAIDRTLELSQGRVVIPEEEELSYDFLREDHSIDCDILVFDEVLVNWPAKVLCSEDCKGLCPICGQNLNEHDCGHDSFVPDPRMAGIQDLFKNFKEV